MPGRLHSGNPEELVQAERDVRARIAGQPYDYDASAVISNIYRAANVVRYHMEQKVLADYDLSWGAFTVLFVLWIWGDQETRNLAVEAGVTKGTLTGVLKTLEARGLVLRRPHDRDGRLVVVCLLPAGHKAMEELFPRFNENEVFTTSQLTGEERTELARLLRTIIRTVEGI
ncbi:MAG: MarR family winged helix-turn-helix transcriptional regulator [Actinomycetota bacterium]|nr:MarR family winged helix-turn-helix transcriptional regulator [Actinomycetota bacterium]MDA8039492.1 MarR family winged helix-turn-helix transcriptional regulator [Actinomycetota bacterium]